MAVYGPNAMSRSAIVKWCQQFEAMQMRVMLIKNEDHQHRPQKIDDMIRSNQRVIITEIAQ